MLTSSVQNQISFKNLFGKSQTNPNFGLVNEANNIHLNIDSRYVWTDSISTSATQSVNDGFAIMVSGVMSEIDSSDGRSCYTLWPGIPPSGVDLKTGESFAYGIGSLVGISAGDRITNIISDLYGVEYEAKPYISSVGDILALDSRDWIYQYNSGIYYQNNPSNGIDYILPNYVRVFVYIGQSLTTNNPDTNIFVTLSGTNSYSSTQSSPTIATYSSSHTYIASFLNSNTSVVNTININSIGTYSVYKYDYSGLVSLNPGDITTSKSYFIKWNSDISSFIFYENSPNYITNKLVNPSTSIISVGGIESGSSFNTNVSDVLYNLIYPEQVGQIDSFYFEPNISTFEVGSTMSLDSYTFSWVLSNTSSFGTNKISIYDYSTYNPTESNWNAGGLIITSLTNTLGSYSVSLGTYSSSYVRSRDFRMSIKRNDGTTITKSTSLNWMYPSYIGTSTYSTLDESIITTSLVKSLTNSSIGSWIISGTYGYKYLVIPSTYSFSNITYMGLPVAMADITDVSGSYTYSTNDGIGYGLISITNSYGIELEYNIYRTVNQISGTFTVLIN